MKALDLRIASSLVRLRAQGLATRVARDVEYGYWRTPTGIVYPGYVFSPSASQIGRVVERITRGLHFRELGRRVLDTHQVTMFSEPTLPTFGDALDKLRARPVTQLGAGEFGYQWMHSNTDKGEMSVWLLTFYQAVPFVMGVTPSAKPYNLWLNAPATGSGLIFEDRFDH